MPPKNRFPRFIPLALALLGVVIILSSCPQPTPTVKVVTRVITRVVTPTPALRSRPTRTPALAERVLAIHEADRVVRIVGESRIPAYNCIGKNEVDFSKSISHSIRRRIDVGVKGEVSGILSTKWLSLIKAKLEAHFNFVDGEELTDTTSVTVHAKPGTNLVYRVVWKEVSVTGYVVLEKDNGERVRIPFTVTKSLESELVDPIDVGCPPTPSSTIK